ncbi:hypothetical protein ALC56_00715 [Trachymyrmex septentrionalis]|uniref:Uncharacterized protein n=1 Tax=Trachymyrmex septentrionalis TaxID=34720 RepID=A0A195FVQ7_9HYME|nr:hypothetical protein ALC56_00715 [Trachymyrmex septentrionalis]
MHHTAPWYLPWGLKLVPLPIPPGHPASGIPNPAGLHLLTPLPGIYAPEPRKGPSQNNEITGGKSGPPTLHSVALPDLPLGEDPGTLLKIRVEQVPSA